MNNTEEIKPIESHPHNETGMLTAIWGCSTWESLSCIAFIYPNEPSELDKQHYKVYFGALKFVLPCCVCRKHYTQHTAIGAKHELVDAVFDNRATLTRWLYELHNDVNVSTGMIYDITYDDYFEKYMSYIADCDMTIEKKTIAYKNFYNKEAPLVFFEIAVCFINYANLRGLTDFEEKLRQTNEIFKTKRNADGSISENWIKRNYDCANIVRHMRTNGIIGFEKTEQHHNLPTIEELTLLQNMSTTLNIKSLKHMIEKLGFKNVSDTI